MRGALYRAVKLSVKKLQDLTFAAKSIPGLHKQPADLTPEHGGHSQVETALLQG